MKISRFEVALWDASIYGNIKRLTRGKRNWMFAKSYPIIYVGD